jgi:hypothetical protein
LNRHGAVYLSDFHSGLVHKVNRVGIIRTVAGSREVTRVGDGGSATAANCTTRGAVDARGDLFIAEHHGERIRKVRPTRANSLKESQIAARSGPSCPRRTSPTDGMKTASLEAAARTTTPWSG